MFEQRIEKKEFLRNPFVAATEVLLGSYLCSTIDGKFTAGRITELEVYIGAEDKACHAYLNRKTPRNAAMFETGGCAYVFLFTECIISLMSFLMKPERLRPRLFAVWSRLPVLKQCRRGGEQTGWPI